MMVRVVVEYNLYSFTSCNSNLIKLLPELYREIVHTVQDSARIIISVTGFSSFLCCFMWPLIWVEMIIGYDLIATLQAKQHSTIPLTVLNFKIQSDTIYRLTNYLERRPDDCLQGTFLFEEYRKDTWLLPNLEGWSNRNRWRLFSVVHEWKTICRLIKGHMKEWVRVKTPVTDVIILQRFWTIWKMSEYN